MVKLNIIVTIPYKACVSRIALQFRYVGQEFDATSPPPTKSGTACDDRTMLTRQQNKKNKLIKNKAILGAR